MDKIKFELNNQETIAANKFIEEHKKCCAGKPFSSLGMQFTYMITPGGFGSQVSIRCNKCGKVEDITDISSW